jgi:hypothetical protein
MPERGGNELPPSEDWEEGYDPRMIFHPGSDATIGLKRVREPG